MFCLYGFAAAAEPGPNHTAFRIGYAIVGSIAFVLAFVIGIFMRGNARRDLSKPRHRPNGFPTQDTPS